MRTGEFTEVTTVQGLAAILQSLHQGDRPEKLAPARCASSLGR